MSHFGDLLAGKPTAAPVVPPVAPPVEEPVYEAPGTPASVEPDIAPPVPSVTVAVSYTHLTLPTICSV